ncbi:T9SS type A sorting domain-containing protein [candidate division KSB1 bacterium]|nr:T9SS type A sorting domain-containing protein [candidate division KSB1 bacterium]
MNKGSKNAALVLILFLPSFIHSQTNIAPLGTAYTWAHNLESTADSNKVACPELNDGDQDSIIWLSRGEQGEGVDDIINAWQAAGVVWETAHEIVEVVYVNGPYDGTVYANGAFSQEESFRLQVCKDGTTWEDVKIYEDPTYTYFKFDDVEWGALVTDQPFSFKGVIGTVMGVRVTGVVHNWEAGSWNATCRQILAYSTETDVLRAPDLFPTQFELFQNYPNPFNPTTTISYEIAAAEFVSLTIYDMNGRLVHTLVSQKQIPGRYTVVWEGKSDTGELASSGFYCCRLQAGEVNQSIRMLLLR